MGAKEYKAKLYLKDSIYTKGYLLFAVMVPILTIGTLVYLTFHVLRIGIHYLFQKRKRQSVSARRSAMPCFFSQNFVHSRSPAHPIVWWNKFFDFKTSPFQNSRNFTAAALFTWVSGFIHFGDLG